MHGLGVYVALAARSSRSRRRDAESAYASFAHRLEIAPPARFRPAAIDTYDDHRMAMCFALAALGGVAVTIHDPACVRKTFPDYFDVLARISQR